jgi:hypothetical protein
MNFGGHEYPADTERNEVHCESSNGRGARR